MTTLNDANQSDVSTADQTEQTTDVAIALLEEVRAREYHPKTSPPCDAHASSVRAVVTPRCVRVPQVSSDPGKFAGDDVITEQTAQTFSAVLGTTETMSDTTVDAITEALQEARDLSAQPLGGRSLAGTDLGRISRRCSRCARRTASRSAPTPRASNARRHSSAASSPTFPTMRRRRRRRPSSKSTCRASRLASSPRRHRSRRRRRRCRQRRRRLIRRADPCLLNSRASFSR